MKKKNLLKPATFMVECLRNSTIELHLFLISVPFFSAARSVLQYAKKEAESKSGRLQWYINHFNKSTILSFFKGKRNINIHAEPVNPLQHTEVTGTITVYTSVSLSVTHLDANGKVLYQSAPEMPEVQPKRPDPPATVETHYAFADWNGSEDVMTLSQMYLDELKHVVEDGIQNGFLTGQ